MQSLKRAIKYLIFGAAFLPILISDSFLFPFVVPRTAVFYALVESAFLLFIVLWISGKLPKLDVKQNKIFLAFLAFVAVGLVSAFFGLSFKTSFFSSIERSWGVLMLLNFAFFFALLRLFFERKDWLLYFKLSVWTSLVVSIIGILQYFGSDLGISMFLSGKGRILSTLGNPIYVAIYLLINSAFALHLFFQKNSSGKLNYIYLLPIAFNFLGFLLAETRGAYLGLIGGFSLAVFLYIFFGENRKVKKLFIAGFCAVVFLLALAFAFPENKIIKNTPILDRISSIAESGGSVSTRLIGWQAALKGFADHPILGVGPENFNIVFNKYVTPEYYLYATTEPYFDRAHNSYLDVLATEGALGILAYLSLFVISFYFLYKAFFEKKIGLNEFIIFCAILFAYAIHVFFVFDDLNSFLLFVVLMAFFEFSRSQKTAFSEGAFSNPDALQKTFGVVIAVVLIFFVDSLPSKDITASFIDFLYSSVGSYDEILKDKDKEKVFKESLDIAKKAIEKEILRNANDALLYQKYAALDNAFFIAYSDKKYIDESVKNMQKALSLSPQRPQYYQLISETYSISNDHEKAIEYAKKA
ncbi:O-antigen ligase family protein, partial [Candidatus Azambacteria bacterium]|nr:O-antigen ligase family protein [Candidatus Azambacteria bacterium]